MGGLSSLPTPGERLNNDSSGPLSLLWGPEESLFERSQGVGREERPPIAVVIQTQEHVLPSNNLCFNICVLLNVMFVVYDVKI